MPATLIVSIKCPQTARCAYADLQALLLPGHFQGEKMVEDFLKKYKKNNRTIWAQDEPENMGAWPYISRRYDRFNFEAVARKESASPAGGLLEQHNIRLQLIVDTIFNQ